MDQHAQDARLMPPPALPFHSGRPSVSVPGAVLFQSLLGIAEQHKRKPVIGYNESHALYEKIRNELQRAAYSSMPGSAEVVVIRANMVSLRPGNQKRTPVGVSANS